MGATPRESIFIVLPAYNEAPAVGAVVAPLVAEGYSVVVVDDGSGDATAEEAGRAGAAVLRHALNRGQGAALQTGIAYSLARDARAVVTFDSDGQHRPEDLERLLAPVLAGEADIVLGSRFLGDQGSIPFRRRWVLRAAVLFTRLSSRLRVTDTHNGLRAFSHRGARALDIRLDRMAHASEILDQIATSGLPYREVPVEVRYTAYSRAKGQRSSAALKIALDYIFGRWFR